MGVKAELKVQNWGNNLAVRIPAAVALVVLTVAMIVMLRKRWRHASPVYKCTVFSVWSHLLLVIYATSIQIVAERQGPGNGGDGPVSMRVQLTAEEDATEAQPKPPQAPVEKPPQASDPTIPRTVTSARCTTLASDSAVASSTVWCIAMPSHSSAGNPHLRASRAPIAE